MNMDALLAADQALAQLSHASPAFDEAERLAVLEEALHAITPAQCFVLRKRGATKNSLLERAFAGGHAKATRLVVDRARHASHELRTASTFIPTFALWRDERLDQGLELWQRVVGGGGHLPQGAWLKAAREAIAHRHAPWLRRITLHDGFWGKDGEQALDAITAIVTSHCPKGTLDTGGEGDVHAAAVAAVERGWARLGDTDPRLSHKAPVWAIGIARLGWLPPDHTRQRLFATIKDRVQTAHAVLHFLDHVRPWEQWVGLHESDVHTRLLKSVGADPHQLTIF